MENASKALLIAGAILLVITLIAVGMSIFGAARGVTDRAEEQVDNMKIQMHNQQFTEYEGEVTGEQVKECISKMLANNEKATSNDFKVGVRVYFSSNTSDYVTYIRKSDVSASTTDELLREMYRINNNDIFRGEIFINGNGIIYGLYFRKS